MSTDTPPVPDFSGVGPRQPCPCGSGRRFKACHGSTRGVNAVTSRPFAGLADEPDWVALREVVPSATAPLAVTGPAAPEGAGNRDVLLVTLLPLAWPALVRRDGQVLLSLQTPARSGDASRDLGQALVAALAAEPGQGLGDLVAPDADGPRLQDLIGVVPLDVTVHRGFDWWLGEDQPSDEARAQLEQANAGVVPTERLTSVPAAYWCRMAARSHLRWAMSEDEDALLDALARLSAVEGPSPEPAGQSGAPAGGLSLGEGTRYVGAFRADGLMVPVWDLPLAMTAAECEQPVEAMRERLAAALARSGPLTSDERRARAGLVSRSMTLR